MAQTPMVIDNGSYMIKAGYGGEDGPRSTFPSVIGRHHSGCQDIVIGDEAMNDSNVISRPIHNGMIININDMESIWDHVFETFRIAPHSLLMTDKPPSNTNMKQIKTMREKITQLIFETYEFPQFHIISDAILSLYSTGRTTGIVLDAGYDITNIVPIQNGKYIAKGVKQLNLCGKDLTKYLHFKLTERGYDFTNYAKKQIVNDMKEKFGFVALDFEKQYEFEMRACGLEKNYELPDGQVVTIGDPERMLSSEPLFHPDLVKNSRISGVGIDNLLIQSIMNCQYGIRQTLLENVVLNGGSTMFNGFGDRINKELNNMENNGFLVDVAMITNGYLRKVVHHNMYQDILDLICKKIHKMDFGMDWKVKIIASPQRKYNVWLGGSLLCTMASFNDQWIKKEQYDEFGASIVQKMCNDLIIS